MQENIYVVPVKSIDFVDNSFLPKTKQIDTFNLKTNGKFLWRLWFLISAPFIFLIKGEVKIK